MAMWSPQQSGAAGAQGWGGGGSFRPWMNPAASQATQTAPAATTNTALSPAYLSTMFPNGLPMSSIDTSTDAITKQIMDSLLPQFTQQNDAMNAELASAGIMGGSAPGAMAALGKQQQTQAMGDIAPYIMEGKQLGIGQQEFDIGNILRAAMTDQATQNEFMRFVLSGQNQDWLAKMGMAGGLAGGEAGAITGAYNPTYQTPPNLMSSFMQFGQGSGPMPGPLPPPPGL